jgi:hypothetical protein
MSDGVVAVGSRFGSLVRFGLQKCSGIVVRSLVQDCKDARNARQEGRQKQQDAWIKKAMRLDVECNVGGDSTHIYVCVYKAVLPHAAFSIGVRTYTEYVTVQ